MIEMTSPRLSQFLYGIAFTLISTSYVRSQDYIVNVTMVDVGFDFFTLKWEWVVDDADDYDPWGCEIVTRINDNSLRIINEVIIEGLNTSYTVRDNVTSWELYRSCITPFLTNGTVIVDGDRECTEIIQTKYDPWTLKAEIAVIISGGLIFLLLVAQLINFKWPRDQKRTFTLDDDLDEEDDVDGKAEPVKDTDNLGFEQDEDATSSVNDWNAAAAVAVVEGKSGRKPGNLRQWVKHTERNHQTTRLFHDIDVNQNSSHVQPHMQPTDEDVLDDNAEGNVDEGVPAVEEGNTNLRPQPAHHNQEPLHSIYNNQQGVSDDYDQGIRDVAVRDSAYQNYGYEDDLSNGFGNDRYQSSQQPEYPLDRGFATHPFNDMYDTTIPRLENDYSQYSQ